MDVMRPFLVFGLRVTESFLSCTPEVKSVGLIQTPVVMVGHST